MLPWLSGEHQWMNQVTFLSLIFVSEFVFERRQVPLVACVRGICCSEWWRGPWPGRHTQYYQWWQTQWQDQVHHWQQHHSYWWKVKYQLRQNCVKVILNLIFIMLLLVPGLGHFLHAGKLKVKWHIFIENITFLWKIPCKTFVLFWKMRLTWSLKLYYWMWQQNMAFILIICHQGANDLQEVTVKPFVSSSDPSY